MAASGQSIKKGTKRSRDEPGDVSLNKKQKPFVCYREEDRDVEVRRRRWAVERETLKGELDDSKKKLAKKDSVISALTREKALWVVERETFKGENDVLKKELANKDSLLYAVVRENRKLKEGFQEYLSVFQDQCSKIRVLVGE